MKNTKNSREKAKSRPIKIIISENNKFTKAIALLTLGLIVLGLFAFIIAGLYNFGLIDFPEFIKNIFFKTDPENPEPEKAGNNIYDFLRDNNNSGPSGGSGGFFFELTLENVREAIARTQLPDNLYLETEAVYYIDGKPARKESMALWKKGGKYKYTLAVNSEPEESYTNDSRFELIENFKTGSRTRNIAPEAFSFDNIPHTVNINYYLDLIESGEITGFAARRGSESDIIEIEYSVPQLSQREFIYISIETGVVERTALYTGDGQKSELFYESTTKLIEFYNDGDGAAPEITSIQDSLFETGTR